MYVSIFRVSWMFVESIKFYELVEVILKFKCKFNSPQPGGGGGWGVEVDMVK